MFKNLFFCLFIVFLPCKSVYLQDKGPEYLTIGFYNVENLFDPLDDPKARDDDFTPSGRFRYGVQDYRDKLKNISYAISGIGSSNDRDGPELIGLAEVENLEVLKALIQEESLKDKDYRIIHQDSEDPRGIDVAMIYKDSFFLPLTYSFHKVALWDKDGIPIKTRDVLYVHGLLKDEEIHLLINHWPSRRGGSIKSAPRRKKAAYVNRRIISGIQSENPYARIVVMGDFNDDPIDESIRIGLCQKDEAVPDSLKILNPMENMYRKGLNSMAYRDALHLFDQILISNSLLSPEYSEWAYSKMGIYNPTFLITSRGRYTGYPRRGFVNGRYDGGYSDHFPVYLELKRLDR